MRNCCKIYIILLEEIFKVCVCRSTRIGRRNVMKISFHKCIQHKIYKIFIYAKWYVHLESSQLKGHVYDKMQIPRAIVVDLQPPSPPAHPVSYHDVNQSENNKRFYVNYKIFRMQIYI